MNIVLSEAQIAGSNLLQYENFFKKLNPSGDGRIQGLEAAEFLKKSGLSDLILSKIWDLADQEGKGWLDKKGFFIALKLITLYQNGKPISLQNLDDNIGPLSNYMVDNLEIFNTGIDRKNDSIWPILPNERKKYEQLFESLIPKGGKIHGSEARPFMLSFKLSLEILSKIWELADIDKDGYLDKEEFILGMHLIYKALENYQLPDFLPIEVVPTNKYYVSSSSLTSTPITSYTHSHPPVPPPPVNIPSNIEVRDLPFSISASLPPPPILPLYSSLTSAAHSVTSLPNTVSDALPTYSDTHQNSESSQTDTDKDGFVNGTEIRDLFLQSGLQQSMLAHIWNLCDISQSGKLNQEQFALAMWFITQKQLGNDPPPLLLPEMVPPSLRSKSKTTLDITNVTKFANPELQALAKEVEEIIIERMQLEQEITKNETELTAKTVELKNLQNELSTLKSSSQQLEKQKGEAQKILDNLDLQYASLKSQLQEMKVIVQKKEKEVSQLQIRVTEQERSIQEQEEELDRKQREVEELKEEEENLEAQVNSAKSLLENLNQKTAKVQLESTQDCRQQLLQSMQLFDAAILSGDTSSIGEIMFQDKHPIWKEFEYESENSPIDLHSDNAFEYSETKIKEFLKTAENTDNIHKDEFQDHSFEKNSILTDPFAPTGGISVSHKEDLEKRGDLFGSDPFIPVSNSAVSPTPLLPPKMTKHPPPRPAPPKSAGAKSTIKPPIPASPLKHHSEITSDSFNANFADFANFNQFFSNSINKSDPWTFSNNLNDHQMFDKSDPFQNEIGSDSIWGETKLDYKNHITNDPFSPNVVSAKNDINMLPFFPKEWSWFDEDTVENKHEKLKQEEKDYELTLALSKSAIS